MRFESSNKYQCFTPEFIQCILNSASKLLITNKLENPNVYLTLVISKGVNDIGFIVMIVGIFKLFIRERRLKTVAEHLNAEGHRTSNGTYFTGQAVSRILNDKKHLDDGTVSPELWDQCQEIISANKRRGSTRRVAHLCSGILKCGCGQTMYVPTNSKKYVCSKCRNKIAKDDLEAIVLENLKNSDIPDIHKGLSIWPSLSLAEKREIVESCVEQIIAEGKKVTVSLFAFG